MMTALMGMKLVLENNKNQHTLRDKPNILTNYLMLNHTPKAGIKQY